MKNGESDKNGEHVKHLLCIGEYSDEVAKKPVSDGEKGESGMQKKKHERVDGNLNEASKYFPGKMVNLANLTSLTSG